MSFSIVPITHRFGRDWLDWPNRGFFDDEPFQRLEESVLQPNKYHKYYLIQQEGPTSPRHQLTRQLSAVAPEVRSEEGNFHVLLDVSQFRPEELEVKVVDNTVAIQGKHEEKGDDHVFVSREFTRRYNLPDGVDPKSITSSLNSQGVLSIKAPRKLAIEASSSERDVPIKVHHVTTETSTQVS